MKAKTVEVKIYPIEGYDMLRIVCEDGTYHIEEYRWLCILGIPTPVKTWQHIITCGMVKTEHLDRAKWALSTYIDLKSPVQKVITNQPAINLNSSKNESKLD